MCKTKNKTRNNSLANRKFVLLANLRDKSTRDSFVQTATTNPAESAKRQNVLTRVSDHTTLEASAANAT